MGRKPLAYRLTQLAVMTSARGLSSARGVWRKKCAASCAVLITPPSVTSMQPMFGGGGKVLTSSLVLFAKKFVVSRTPALANTKSIRLDFAKTFVNARPTES